ALVRNGALFICRCPACSLSSISGNCDVVKLRDRKRVYWMGPDVSNCDFARFGRCLLDLADLLYLALFWSLSLSSYSANFKSESSSNLRVVLLRRGAKFCELIWMCMQ